MAIGSKVKRTDSLRRTADGGIINMSAVYGNNPYGPDDNEFGERKDRMVKYDPYCCDF